MRVSCDTQRYTRKDNTRSGEESSSKDQNKVRASSCQSTFASKSLVNNRQHYRCKPGPSGYTAIVYTAIVASWWSVLVWTRLLQKQAWRRALPQGSRTAEDR